MFDGIMFEGKFKNYIDKVVDTIDRPENEKWKLFDEVTAIYNAELREKASLSKSVA